MMEREDEANEDNKYVCDTLVVVANIDSSSSEFHTKTRNGAWRDQNKDDAKESRYSI